MSTQLIPLFSDDLVDLKNEVARKDSSVQAYEAEVRRCQEKIRKLREKRAYMVKLLEDHNRASAQPTSHVFCAIIFIVALWLVSKVVWSM